jgi:hypothetical protein
MRVTKVTANAASYFNHNLFGLETLPYGATVPIHGNLMVEKKSCAIDQCPSEVLDNGQTFILKLFTTG